MFGMIKMNKIVIPYTPRPIWKKEIHPALDKHRFAVLVCHRRFGKSVGVINQMIKKAIKNNKRSPRYAYLAPFRNQAKTIAWEYLKFYTSVIPGIKVNESDLFVEFPSLFPNSAGARITIVGADHPDALRGGYLDGVALDEFAQIKQELWGEVIRPQLADRKGWAVFVGTPKGQNQFYEMYQRAVNDASWFSCLYRASETDVLEEAELEEMCKDMTDIEYRQEMLCDFTASASNVLITIDMVEQAIKQHYTEVQVRGMADVLGVDVARFGDDRSTIFRRKGLVAYKPKVFKGMDNMEFASVVIQEINEVKPSAVFIDAGQGQGVIDRIRQLGYANIIEVPFGSSASDKTRYANKRAEMYYLTREWLTNGGSIPDIPELKNELTVCEYKFDQAGRMKLEPKEQIKEKLGKSPDLADALVLTFAYPVSPTLGEFNRQATMCRTEYNPFDF